MLFPCPIQVNNSFLPTRVFTSYRIKTVVFRMVLIYNVVLGLVNWPFEVTISVFLGDFRRLLAALDRCTFNKGAFAFKIIRGALKWPLKGGSRLIEVAATAGN